MASTPGIVAQEILAELYLALVELERLPVNQVLKQVKERIERASRLTRAVIALYSQRDCPDPSKLPPGQDRDP